MIIAAALITVSATVIIILRIQPGASEQGTGEPVIYTVQEVNTTTAIDISGNIEPYLATDHTFGISGTVEQIFVEEGDRVTEGTLLAKLEDIEIIYDITSLQYDLNQASITGSKNTLNLLNLNMEVLQAELEDTQIEADFDGIVSEVNIEEGDNVAAGSAENAYTAVRVINTEKLTAEVEVDEIDVPAVKVGQTIRISFDALPELEVLGSVSAIAAEAKVSDQGFAVADVEISIEDPDPQILPYYSFTGEILMSEEDLILIIEKEAVIDRNGSTMVMKIPADGSRPAPTEIKVSEYDSTHYEILSGLEKGDRVIGQNNSSPSGRASSSSESSETNPMQMLGLPTPGRGTGGGPPPRD